jgi:hypothetical protein
MCTVAPGTSRPSGAITAPLTEAAPGPRTMVVVVRPGTPASCTPLKSAAEVVAGRDGTGSGSGIE